MHISSLRNNRTFNKISYSINIFNIIPDGIKRFATLRGNQCHKNFKSVQVLCYPLHEFVLSISDCLLLSGDTLITGIRNICFHFQRDCKSTFLSFYQKKRRKKTTLNSDLLQHSPNNWHSEAISLSYYQIMPSMNAIPLYITKQNLIAKNNEQWKGVGEN